MNLCAAQPNNHAWRGGEKGGGGMKKLKGNQNEIGACEGSDKRLPKHRR